MSSAAATKTVRPWWAIGLVAWTVFVWGSRVRNVLADEELTAGALTWRLAVALGFVALALVGAVQLVRRVRPSGLMILGAVGPVWWLLRGGQILVGDWSVAFKAVHTVLALVTIGLSWMVLRWIRLRSAPYG